MEQEYNIENQFTFFEQKSKDVFTKSLAELKAEYEAKDWEIFHSKWRKNQGYILHGTKNRTIVTIFGSLTYYAVTRKTPLTKMGVQGKWYSKF